MKKKIETLALAAKMIKIIECTLYNEELYNIIMAGINDITFKNNDVMNIMNTGIAIEDRKTKDYFSIMFLPNIDNYNEIVIEESNYERKNVETITIKFESNKTIIEKRTTDTTIYPNNVISSVSHKQNNMIYIDNQLVYDYKYVVETPMNPYEKTSYSLEEITHINGHNAVIRRTVVGEKDAFMYNDSHVIYSGTEAYDAQPFNTRQEKKRFIIYGLHRIDENKYNSVVKNICEEQKNKEYIK